MTTQETTDVTLREKAIKQLKKKHDLRGHLLIYTLVNTFLVVIWFAVTPDMFFWPIFPLVGWGIGVVMNVWDVYFSSDFTEADIEREITHLRHR